MNSRSIIDSISGHGHDFSICLKGSTNTYFFMLRAYTSEKYWLFRTSLLNSCSSLFSISSPVTTFPEESYLGGNGGSGYRRDLPVIMMVRIPCFFAVAIAFRPIFEEDLEYQKFPKFACHLPGCRSVRTAMAGSKKSITRHFFGLLFYFWFSFLVTKCRNHFGAPFVVFHLHSCNMVCGSHPLFLRKMGALEIPFFSFCNTVFMSNIEQSNFRQDLQYLAISHRYKKLQHQSILFSGFWSWQKKVLFLW